MPAWKAVVAGGDLVAGVVSCGGARAPLGVEAMWKGAECALFVGGVVRVGTVPEAVGVRVGTGQRMTVHVGTLWRRTVHVGAGQRMIVHVGTLRGVVDLGNITLPAATPMLIQKRYDVFINVSYQYSNVYRMTIYCKRNHTGSTHTTTSNRPPRPSTARTQRKGNTESRMFHTHATNKSLLPLIKTDYKGASAMDPYVGLATPPALNRTRKLGNSPTHFTETILPSSTPTLQSNSDAFFPSTNHIPRESTSTFMVQLTQAHGSNEYGNLFPQSTATPSLGMRFPSVHHQHRQS